jgi:hypothetical protein
MAFAGHGEQTQHNARAAQRSTQLVNAVGTDTFAYIVAGLYWCLIVCWLIILLFYWREHRRLTALSPMIGTMLVVVFLDGARTLLESIYFGAWYTARTGILPRFLWQTLAEPQYVLVPKVLNLLAAA